MTSVPPTQPPAAPETDADNWWDAVTHESLRRLAGADPALLSPVGRELREYAQGRSRPPAHPPAAPETDVRLTEAERKSLWRVIAGVRDGAARLPMYAEHENNRRALEFKMREAGK